MSVYQNMNQFTETPIKGQVSAIVNPETISVRVDINSSATIVPGDLVYLTTVAAFDILVDKVTSLTTQSAFGVVAYALKKDKFVAGDVMEIVLNGSVLYVEATGTINRGQGAEFVQASSSFIVSGGVNPTAGLSLDNVTTGNLFRLLVRTSPNSQSIGLVTPEAGQFTQLNTVSTVIVPSVTTASINPQLGGTFTIVPSQSITLNAASVKAGQSLFFVVTTSGTTNFNIIFGTNFKTTGTMTTGTASGKVFVVEFIGDGTNYNQVNEGIVVM